MIGPEEIGRPSMTDNGVGQDFAMRQRFCIAQKFESIKLDVAPESIIADVLTSKVDGRDKERETDRRK